MNRIKVLIVEDEWIVSEELKQLLEKNGYAVVGQAAEANEAMKLAAVHNPDLALLDININGENDGIGLAEELRSKSNLAIIFLTAYSDTNILERAKKVRPESYIVKPFVEKNLIIAIDLAVSKLETRVGATTQAQDESIFIKDGSSFVKLAVDNIKYVEADGSYCNIYSHDNRHTLAMNLKHFQSKVHHPDILRIHRSFMANLRHVTAIDDHKLIIGDISLPISDSYYERVIGKFKLI